MSEGRADIFGTEEVEAWFAYQGSHARNSRWIVWPGGFDCQTEMVDFEPRQRESEANSCKRGANGTHVTP